MAKTDIGSLETAVNSGFKVAQEALDGARAVDQLAKKLDESDLDAETKKQVLELKKRFLNLSSTASTTANTVSELAPLLRRSST